MIITRKIDLSRFGMRYENIDFTTNEHPTKEECLAEVKDFIHFLYVTFLPRTKARLEELNKKQTHNADEVKEKEELEGKVIEPPF